jgi:hypothetical protein
MFDASFMRTTLTLDDDVLIRAKALARQRDKTLGEVVSDLLRRGLSSGAKPAIMRSGLRLFPVRRGAGQVTPEVVKQLLEETD